jgi:hypothetical protein
MKRSVLAFSVGILLISFTAFAASKNESTTVAPQSLPTVTAAPQQDATLSGRVVETMDSGGYTYVQI